jgi:hypothetical protein
MGSAEDRVRLAMVTAKAMTSERFSEAAIS